jgi:hypothetical protein
MARIRSVGIVFLLCCWSATPGQAFGQGSRDLREIDVLLLLEPEPVFVSSDLPHMKEILAQMDQRPEIFTSELRERYRALVAEYENTVAYYNGLAHNLKPAISQLKFEIQELDNKIADHNADSASYKRSCSGDLDKAQFEVCQRWFDRLANEDKYLESEWNRLADSVVKQNKRFDDGPKTQYERLERDKIKPLRKTMEDTWNKVSDPGAGWAQCTLQNNSGIMLDLYVDGVYQCTALAHMFCTTQVKAGTHDLKAQSKDGKQVITMDAVVFKAGESRTWSVE